MDQTRQEQQQNKKNNTQLLLRFLKGSKLLFVLSIACSALVTLVDMLNPQIIEQDGEQTGYEGCLSVPGKVGEVTRPNRVVVRYNDLEMNEWEMEAEEFLARAVCHELDHLDGHLYVEKVKGELRDSSELEAVVEEEEEEESDGAAAEERM